MKTKVKTIYACQSCGAIAPKWSGQCGECQAWNALVEQVLPEKGVESPRYGGYAAEAGDQEGQPVLLSEVALNQETRATTSFTELDRVLGGGLVAGSVVLLGGDPGIGKSTLLLQVLAALGKKLPVLYVSGEESLQQITLRSRRSALSEEGVFLLAETRVEAILQKVSQQKPRVLVVDSIQTVYTQQLNSAPGSVAQVRECAMQLTQHAKQTQTTLFLVGHVTKEGMIAGPRVLEHMVDTVLYFEGERSGRLRMLRSVKNRFGAVNELGVFAMTEKGLREVSNPSSIFLSSGMGKVPGGVVLVAWEGSRPILVEVQALVDDSYLANPRRVAVGLEANRLAMLLAVLHRHGGIAAQQQDIFANVVGGMRVTETAADLALLLAIVSSLRNKPLPDKWVVFGELGLAGEIRPVHCGEERLREAAKHGFTHAVVPYANLPKQPIKGFQALGVKTLAHALQVVTEQL